MAVTGIMKSYSIRRKYSCIAFPFTAEWKNLKGILQNWKYQRGEKDMYQMISQSSKFFVQH